MPDQRKPPELKHFELETESFLKPEKKLSSKEALALVKRSYEVWSNWRQNSQDPKWQKSYDLYVGRVDQKSWDKAGKWRRSAIPVRLAYAHCATVATKISTALFSREPFWFDLVDSQDPPGAAQERELLSYYLEIPSDRGISSVAHMKQAVHNHYVVLGTAMGQVGWDNERRIPFLRHLDPRSVFISPKTRLASEGTEAWILKDEISVRDIKALDKSVFNIPSDDELFYMAKNKPGELEVIRSAQGQLGLFDTLQEEEPNPMDATIEVLAYESKERIIWVLNQEWVLYSVPNPFRMLTLVMANYSDTDVSPYGEGIPELVGPEQLLQQTLLNAYIDEVSLRLMPPRSRVSSLTTRGIDTTWRPGMELTVQDASKDFVVHQIEPVTGEALAMIGLSAQRAQQMTGMSQLSISGVPTPSNGTRTATGMSTMASATSERILHAVENFENFFIVPALKKCSRIIDVMERRPPRERNFKIFGSSRVMLRERLPQMLPMLLQYVLNPEIQGALNSVGQTADFSEINRLVQDALGTAEKYQLFRQLTEQEVAAQQQASQEQQQGMQEKIMELQTRLQIAEGNNRTKLQAEEIKAGTKQHETAEKSATALSLKMLEARETPDGKKSK